MEPEASWLASRVVSAVPFFDICVSKAGKEATIGILNDDDFCGEGYLTGGTISPVLRKGAVTDCTVTCIEKI